MSHYRARDDFPRVPRPLGLVGWIDVQDSACCFRPVSAFGVGIKQAQVSAGKTDADDG